MNRFKLNDFFNLSEFVCPCCGTVRLDEDLIEPLTQLRRDRGRIIVTPNGGGFRCPAYQKAIKYARTETGRPQPVPTVAAHTLGQAADVSVFSVNTGAKIPLTNNDIPYLKSLGFNGIGIGHTGWAHLDIAHTEKPSVWSYTW